MFELNGDTSAATGRLISGFSHPSSRPPLSAPDMAAEGLVPKYSTYLYGNAGKRKAVEQFFLMILQEEKPQTLLLYSDENMAWLYEDPAFAKHWAELFTKVIMKGNRVKIIHTVSRDMNEMLEAITKWVPIYMTGMIEPYCYPRLRDGIFQRTIFIAPNTAAIISSSVQQDTDGMLNLFITDKAAIKALILEYDRYFSLCRPLMQIYTEHSAAELGTVVESLTESEGNAYLYCAMPPLFAMPEKLLTKLTKLPGNESLRDLWKKSLSEFKKNIKKQHLSLVLLDPKAAASAPDKLHLFMEQLFRDPMIHYTEEQYLLHIENLLQMEKQYENLAVFFVNEIPDNTILYMKEDTGVIMAYTGSPKTAFVFTERNMINAFWDYMEKCILA